MSKIIIKLNAFMGTKELDNVYNFIYDQYNKRDIIFVPCYCDVYVVDGDSELKIEKFDAHKLRDEGKSLNEIAKDLGYNLEDTNNGT